MSSYSTLQGHRSMVFDGLRNKYYGEAIKKIVKKDSIVLDLGAGLGLHGLIAANAGAKKVYLVEPASVIEMARQVVDANNHGKQVVCISGKIEEIELPEKVDVIISVFTGNFLLTEDLLPSLFFARDKYLSSGGKLIPDRAVMEVAPVTAPEYYAKHIDCWKGQSQSVAFSQVRDYAANTLFHDEFANRDSEFLALPTDLLEMDFMTASEASCQSQAEVEVTRDGLCHGWLGWFRIRLGENWLSTSPLEKQTHWRQVFLPLAKPISVKKGKKIRFELNRPEFGEWTWTVGYRGKKQRQSTFLSEPISPTALQKKSDHHKPRMSKKGKATLEVLSHINGSASTAEIVDIVMTKFGAIFRTRQLADRFVKVLVDKYGS